MSYKIVIVEDEEDISLLLKHNLEKEGYRVNTFLTPSSFLQSLKKDRFDLLLLDLMLPEMNGLEIIRLLRNNQETKNIPIIVLTAKDTELDKVLGLELGADDYITKPFGIKELLARVKTILRRTIKSESPHKDNSVQLGAIKVDETSFQAFVENKRLDLTKTEFLILKQFIASPNKVFTRDTLLERLWSGEKFVIDRTIDVHVKKLRDKLGKYGHHIKTVRGVGYIFEWEQE